MLELNDLDINILKDSSDIYFEDDEIRDIAIIGMAVKLPMSENIDEFWNGLRSGIDCVKEFPSSRRKDIDDYLKYVNGDEIDIHYDENAYLDEIDKFDYSFFGLSPREASLMDPNQRLFLEIAWKTIEDSGYGGKKLVGSRTGVYVGFSSNSAGEYKQLISQVDRSSLSISTAGNLASIIASRISYLLDLRGPSMLIDTACSSSLVAVHQACKAIRNGECDQALVGGVKINYVPFASNNHDSIGVESSYKRARTFDDDSDGTCGGEGVVAIFLKPLNKAKKDRDHIYAVIKGSAVNQDGSSIGITAPNPLAQEDVISRAWEDADIDPSTISYIEAHGTGTKLGDPIEIEGITRAFNRYTKSKQFCAIGSVKTNIGHLDSAAGIAGLIKVVCALKYKELPPILHFNRPNRNIEFENSPVYINDTLSRWHRKEFPRRAGVSSFGMSGTNCHIVLEEFEVQSHEEIEYEDMTNVLTISAKSRESLDELVIKYIRFLDRIDDRQLRDMCYTANTGRGHYNLRLALIIKDKKDLKNKLEEIKNNKVNLNEVDGVFYNEMQYIGSRKNNSRNKANDNYHNKDIHLKIREFLLSASKNKTVLKDICKAYVEGLEIEWDKLYIGENRRRVNIPTYPFKKIRCWLDIPKGGSIVSKALGTKPGKSNERISNLSNNSNKGFETIDNEISLIGGEGTYSEVEKQVANVWGEMLGFKEISIHDSFYDIGGDSILGFKIINKLSNKLNIKLDISVLLGSETLRDFSDKITEKLGSRDKLGGSYPPLKKVKKSEYYTASSAQKRMYILNHYDGVGTSYNIPSALLIEGELDLRKLESVFQIIVKRHESLRTSFQFVDNHLKQIIDDEIKFKFDYEIAKSYDIENIMKNFVKPFDLSKAPLLRLKLVKIKEHKHVLLLDIHHIIADGISIGLMVEEFKNLYKGEELPEPRFQYKDFAVWQNELFNEGIMKKQEAYWLNMFKGKVPILNMPMDFKRPLVRSYEGDNIIFEASKKLRESINRLANERGATMFMWLFAAYNVLILKYTGQKDIIVGTPVSGRSHIDTEEIVGMFVNTVAMRNYPRGEKTFGEFLDEVKINALKAYENQDYQFEKLIETLNIEKDSSRNPLFDAMMVYQNVGESSLEIDDISLEHIEVNNKVAQFDMTLRVTERDGKLTFNLGYGTKLFKKDTMERFLKHYLNLLHKITENPEAKLSDIEILTDNEKEQILYNFNETDREYNCLKTIHEVFTEVTQKIPENIAVEFGDMTLTYRQLNSKANSLANLLKTKDIQPDDIVGIMMERSIDVIISILGILKSGGAYMPIDPEYPKERIQYMLKDAKPKVIISENIKKYNYVFEDYKGEIIDLKSEKILEVETLENPPCVNNSSDLAYIIYTSGSTGKPKGVMVEHQGVVNLANWQKKIFNVGDNSRISQFATFCFDGAVGEMAMALLNGARLVMLSRKSFSAEDFINALNEKRINVLVITPALLAKLDSSKLLFGEDLTVVSVGEECPVDLGQKWSTKCNFINAYGPTEYTVYSHLWRAEVSDIKLRSKCPIGKSMDNTRTYILDENLKPVPIGVTGEIYVSGHGIARGYLNQLNRTSMSFLLNPYELDKSKIYEEANFLAKEENIDFENDYQNFVFGRREELYADMSKEKLMEEISGFDSDIISKTQRLLDSYDSENPIFKCLFRYFLEGFNDSYKAYGVDEELLRFILPYEDFTALKGIDFGFGNGEVLKRLKGLGAEVKGFDLSPSFVYKGRQLGLDVCQARCDIHPEHFEDEFGIEKNSYDFVISNMVLDRLENPLYFLQNFFQTLKYGGRFAIQLLLPVIGRDDEDVEEPIIYTTPQNQIAFGKSVEQDKLAIVTLVRSLGGRDIKICKFPYTIVSYTGVKTYECWSVFGKFNPEEECLSPENKYSRLYKTGDIGRYLPDGNIEFMGRVDQQVKVRGFRIELGEIESKLLAHENIKEVTVVVNVDENNNKNLCAYFISDINLSAKELREHLVKEIPEYMIPRYFIKLDKIPVNLSGKLDKDALPPPSSRINTGIEYSAPQNIVQENISQVWKDVLGVDRVGIDDDFFVLGGDSIKAVQVMSILSSDFEITMNDIFQHQTIRKLANRIVYKKDNLKNKILQLKGESTEVKVSSKDKEHIEKKMEEYLVKIKKYHDMDLEQQKEYKTILIAGSTGYLGLHIIYDILKTTKYKVYALVRGDNANAATERLINKLEFQFGRKLFDQYSDRMVIVNGDITIENLGMPWNQYMDLANKIDCIINAAANVKHYGIYKNFEDVNVKGTERLINFAMTGKLKDYNHISTLSVASGEIRGRESTIFTEYDCDMGQVSENFYVQTKIESEKAVMKARENGLIANIFRVGSLVFNSSSGRFQENIEDNGFYSVVKSLIRLGGVPQGEGGMFDFSYVNVTCRAIMMLFDKRNLENEIYHIFNPNQISPNQLGRLLNILGYDLSFMSPDNFLDFLYNSYDNMELRQDVESILVHTHMLNSRNQTTFDVASEKTDIIFNRLGFRWDELDVEHMEKMMKHCKDVNFI